MLEQLEKFIVWCEANPVLAVALVGIVWPAFTGLLSFGYHKLEERAPNVVALMRSFGLDLPGVIDAVKKLWPRRLPPLPIFLLAFLSFGCAGVQQLEKAIEKTTAFVAMADPMLRSYYELQRQLCMGHDEPDRTTCLTGVEAQMDPARELLAEVRSVWCTIKPNDCDTDGDGVPDAQDSCPTIPGAAAASGCKVGAL